MKKANTAQTLRETVKRRTAVMSAFIRANEP